MSNDSHSGIFTALTIAGFDPSSGAGITADLAVFAAHGIFGTSAITALTVQSTVGVRRVQPVDADLLRQTLETLQDDLPPTGIKIGMLGTGEQVRAVVEYLRRIRNGPDAPIVVLDPVLRSSSGSDLLDRVGQELLIEELLPLVDVVTPNTVELAVLSGLECESDEEVRSATRTLAARYLGLAVLATGGHRSKPDDLLFHADRFTVLPGEWVETRATHGTGCALSSALLCRLIRGDSHEQAAKAAKDYVTGALGTAVPRGAGRGPMNLLWTVSGWDTGSRNGAE